MRVKSLLFFVLVLFMSGCSFKNEVVYSKPLHVTLKNSSFKISDTGFINKFNNGYTLEVFSAATPVLDLKIYKESVCSGFGCTDKQSFNREFLGNVHYPSFIEDILEFHPIYDAAGLLKTQRGFEQKIVNKSVDILYKVDGVKLYYKDRKNGILLKIKELGDKK